MTDMYQQVEQPDKDNPTTQNLRASYAQLLQDGHTLGPEDFHDAFHSAGFPEVPDLKDQLPSNQELLDHSLEALRQSSMPISPETVHTTRANILNHWATTGTLPDIDHGPTADGLTRQQIQTDPVRQNLSGVIRQIETGGIKDPDAAVSPAGAIGRYQIMPGTAKQYGFDPDQLHDAAYNTMVHNAIVDDLSRRYHGETAAVLIAYNAGPMVADAWIKGGRDISMLPKETQDYLKKADRLTYGDDLMKPGRDAVYDPMGTLGAKNEAPITLIPGVDMGKIAEAAGIPSWEERLKQVDEHVKQMEAEGSSEAERMEYRALNDPFANMFGVGSIGEVAGAALLKMFRTPAQIAERRMNQGAEELVQAGVREFTGEGRQVVAAASTALEEFRKVVNKGIPEFKNWLETNPGKGTPFWQNAPDIMKLLDHVENATFYEKQNMLNGVSGSRLNPSSPLFPVAEAIRGVNQSLRSYIEVSSDPNAIPNFIEDYYRHMWADPSQADRVFGVGRQGSAASLQQRTIPTIMDGIQAGLKPRILDPIENTLHYATGMTNYLTAQRVLEEGKTAGYVKYFSPGQEPGGWEALNGRSATIGNPGIPGATMRLYAPPGYARSYNNWVGGGFYEWAPTRALYPNLQQASNMMTGMKLGLSAFHALNIGFEDASSTIATGFGKIAQGQVIQGFRDVGWGLTQIGPLASKYMRGKWLQDAYLRLGAHPDMTPSTTEEQLASLYARVGGRAIGRGAEYGYQQAQNWGQAWERGALKFELDNGLKGTLGTPGEETLPFRALMTGPRLAGWFGKELGRFTSSFMAPLFDKVIPKLKMASWADEMQVWLHSNPTATGEAILKQGRYLHDAMDDRFGELVQDNLFWPRVLKQTFNLATVSVGWEFGTLRAAARAAKEIGNLNFNGPYARWALAYALNTAWISSVFMYLRSGQLPQIPTDFAAPQTGGKTEGGQPERALLPGIQKDVYQWYHLLQSAPSYLHLPKQVFGYGAGKLNPFMQMTTGFVENRDWKGDPVLSNIRDPSLFGLPDHWTQLGNYIMEAFEPIGAEMVAQAKPGSNISNAERLLGIRPAPEWMQDPQRIENITKHMERNEARKELRQQSRQQR